MICHPEFISGSFIKKLDAEIVSDAMKQVQHDMPDFLEKEILSTLKYFNFFRYPPTFEEIYTFLKIKAQKRQIMSILEKMIDRAVVTTNNKIQFTRNKQYSNKNDFKIKNFKFRRDR